MPSRGYRGWCGQGSLHQSPPNSLKTTQRIPGDRSTSMNETQHPQTSLLTLCHISPWCDCLLFALRFRVYMADLESTLHYSLRVELGAQSVFQGRALTSLKAYISVLAKVQLAELSDTASTKTSRFVFFKAVCSSLSDWICYLDVCWLLKTVVVRKALKNCLFLDIDKNKLKIINFSKSAEHELASSGNVVAQVLQLQQVTTRWRLRQQNVG